MQFLEFFFKLLQPNLFLVTMHIMPMSPFFEHRSCLLVVSLRHTRAMPVT